MPVDVVVGDKFNQLRSTSTPGIESQIAIEAMML
jgi:hypothetical protein